ncbi:DinB family protein [Streptomyces hyaluromycini]|uniref:DinB family protein n=1 Tax=Streptomyces hyaluromycini TaxID=1377993 RepID=A0ABV1XCY2_9ACTN
MPKFADVFLPPELDPRTEPPVTGDEKSLLVGFLRWQRETLELKCSGLDAAALCARSVEFSGLSLLGLVRHLADVEHQWFRERMAGEDTPRRFSGADDPDGAFDHVAPDPDLVAEAWQAWRSEVEYAEQFVMKAESLDVVGGDPWRGEVSLRFVLVHMIEEYARHNGHADLLRQGIDGAVGQ